MYESDAIFKNEISRYENVGFGLDCSYDSLFYFLFFLNEFPSFGTIYIVALSLWSNFDDK